MKSVLLLMLLLCTSVMFSQKMDNRTLYPIGHVPTFYVLDKIDVPDDLLNVDFDTKMLYFDNAECRNGEIYIYDYLNNVSVITRKYTCDDDYVYIDMSEVKFGAFRIFFFFDDSHENFTKLMINLDYKPTMIIPRDRNKNIVRGKSKSNNEITKS